MQVDVMCASCGSTINEDAGAPQVEVRRHHLKKLGDYPYEAREVTTFGGVFCSLGCAGRALTDTAEKEARHA